MLRKFVMYLYEYDTFAVHILQHFSVLGALLLLRRQECKFLLVNQIGLRAAGAAGRRPCECVVVEMINASKLFLITGCRLI